MTTYTWTFPALDAYPSHEGVTNAVFNIHWRMTADDGEGHIAEVYGTQAAGPIDPADFTAFESLTKAQVQGWVEAAMGEEKVAAMKASLDAQIANQITPPVVSLAAPWVEA